MQNKLTVVTGGDIQTNCYILHNDKQCVLFDYVPEVSRFISEMNLTPIAVFLTHIHFDHFQELNTFQKKYKFTLYLTQLGKENINNSQYSLTNSIPPLMAQKSMNVSTESAVSISDGQVINILGMNIKVVFTPGHSLDSTSYIVENENIAFVGDTIFCGGVGRTDLFGGNMKTLVTSRDKLFKMLQSDCTLYPGHGPETTVEDERFL